MKLGGGFDGSSIAAHRQEILHMYSLTEEEVQAYVKRSESAGT